MYTAHYFK